MTQKTQPQPTNDNTGSSNSEDICPPIPPKGKPQKMDFSRLNVPKLKMCPQPPGHVPKTKKQLAREGCVDEEDKPKCNFFQKLICKMKSSRSKD